MVFEPFQIKKGMGNEVYKLELSERVIIFSITLLKPITEEIQELFLPFQWGSFSNDKSLPRTQRSNNKQANSVSNFQYASQTVDSWMYHKSIFTLSWLHLKDKVKVRGSNVRIASSL